MSGSEVVLTQDTAYAVANACGCARQHASTSSTEEGQPVCEMVCQHEA